MASSIWGASKKCSNGYKYKWDNFREKKILHYKSSAMIGKFAQIKQGDK